MVNKLTCILLLTGAAAFPQGRQEPGHSIGTVRTDGDLIVMTLNEGALGHSNFFDLSKRTLRFTPQPGGYRVENRALSWDSDFGSEMTGSQASIHKFTFPFSGKDWDTFSVGVTGSIAFGPSTSGGRGGGVSVDRFAQLQEAGRTILNTVPAICVFFKPRMSGNRYLKETDDRVVITWSLTEPVGGIQDFTWTPTVNRFQAVLHKDGAIDLSYDQLAAKDAVIGVYPLPAGLEKEIATLRGGDGAVRSVKLAAVDGLLLKVSFEMRDPIAQDAEPGPEGSTWRVTFHHPDLVWTIHRGGFGGRGGRGGNGSRYLASGPGVSPTATVAGNTISMTGTLPRSFKPGDAVEISAEGTGSKVAAQTVKLAGIRSPDVDLSSLTPKDGPFAALYESFHYLSLPNSRDLSCTVIRALGDKFDMLAYYSDFRVDNQEAGTPSNGPLGGGPGGGAVTGIGANQRGLDSYCTQGRFQWAFIQPVYVGSNQMQERPPAGVTDTNVHNVATYDHQLGERTPDGHMPPYDYAMSQIGHEMGHRWSAFVRAKVNRETIQLGPTHWARGLQAPVAFPYQRPTEASAMGGGVWQDNYDGTFTQLDDDYYVPATGWSYLDLYLMGLIGPSEVPDFFILRNLTTAGRDANGHPIFKADRTKVTIQDVIAVEGPRMPDVDHAQKKFNTGMVVIVEHGSQPSRELLERTRAIAGRWVDYWETTTGHRSSMTTSVK